MIPIPSFRPAALLLCAGVLLCAAVTRADSPRPNAGRLETERAVKRFVENRGAVQMSDGTAADDVAFFTRTRALRFYFRPSGVSFVVCRPTGGGAEGGDAARGNAARGNAAREEAAERRFEAVRVDMVFPGARAGVLPEGAGRLPVVERRYKGGEQRVAASWSRVVYRDLYPGIDLQFRFGGDGVEYEFLAAPGADIGAIGVVFRGASRCGLRGDGSLAVETPLGGWTEQPPVALQCLPPPAGGGPAPRLPDARFRMDGDTLRFEIDGHDPAFPLLIDPGVRWATYLGGNGEDWSYDIGTDMALNIYVTGKTGSSTFPVLLGQQMSIVGDVDAFLVKYDAGGVLQWATYYGGSGEDVAHGLGVDEEGNVYIDGWTKSGNFPVTGAWQSVKSGDGDAFLAKFNGDGAVRWATFLGGSMDERGTDVDVTPDGGAVMTGWTFSADFPTVNPYQPVMAGSSDIFLARFDSLGTPEWSTFLGGTDFEYAWSIAVNSSNVIAVAGQSFSTNFPLVGAVQTVNGGNADAVVALYSPNGLLQWSTYCGGDENEDGTAVALDVSSNIYLAGSTLSRNFPVLNAFQDKKASLSDGFVAKYSSARTKLWATYYGGNSTDNTAGIGLRAGKAVITGNTGSVTLPLRNAQQTTVVGDEAFVAEFSPGGALTWSTYYGASFNEGGTGVAVDADGVVIICGTTNSNDFPVVSPQQTVHGGGEWDAFVVKFDSCSATAAISAKGPTRFCPGGSVDLEAAQQANATYQWYVNGFKIKGATGATYTATDSGFYRVAVTGASGCSTQSSPIQVILDPLRVDAGRDSTICRGESAIVGGSAAGGTPPYWYAWRRAPGIGDTTKPFLVVTPDTTRYYHLTVVDTLGCTTEDSVLVTVNDFTLKTDGVKALCAGTPVTFGVSVTGGVAPYKYEWTPQQGLTEPNSATTSASPAGPVTYHVTVTDALGCSHTDSVRLVVDVVTVSAGSDRTICAGQSTVLGATVGSGVPPFTYLWQPAYGLDRVFVPNPVAKPDTTTTYVVGVTDANGCMSTSLVTVFVRQGVPPQLVATGPTVFCDGDSVRLSVLNPYPGLRWSTGDTTRSIMVRRDGTYTVTVRDTAGCTAMDSIVVRVYPWPQPVITLLGPSRFCEGDSCVLDAGEGYTAYRWSSGDTTRYVVARQSGRFRVDVTNAGGCSGRSPEVDVARAPMPVLRVEGPRSACQAAVTEHRVTRSAGTTLRWSVSGGTAQSMSGDTLLTVRWGAPGRGAITMEATVDSSGCTAAIVDSIAIGSFLQPSIAPARSLALCPGDTAVLDAGEGYARYRWSTGDTGRTISVSAPGLYRVTVGDAGGCEGSDSALVRAAALPSPVLQAVPAPSACEGDSVTLRLTEVYARYRWSTGDSTPAITVRAPGLYGVEVRNAEGCTGAAAPLRVDFLPLPVPRVDGPASACRYDTMTYVRAPSPGATARWTATGGELVGAGDGDTVRVRWTATTGTLRLEERVDSSGCRGETAVQVAIATPPVPRVTASGPTDLCEGDSVELRCEDGFAWYRWSTGDTGRVLVVRAAGDYVVEVQHASGCRAWSDTFRVRVLVLSGLALRGPASACLQTRGVFDTDSLPGASYAWASPGATIVAGGGTRRAELVWTQRGQVAVRVTVAVGGCSRMLETMVEVGDTLSPRIVVQGPLPPCEGDTVTAALDAAYDRVAWSTGDTTPTLRVTATARIRAHVEQLDGCAGSSAPVDIVFSPRSVAAISGPAEICAGDTAVLTATAPHRWYRWSTGDTTRAIAARSAGSYWLVVRDSGRCESDTARHLLVVHPAPPAPVITASGDTLRSTPAAAYQWWRDGAPLPGATGRTLLPPGDGRYTVSIVDGNGCRAVSAPYTVATTSVASCTIALPALSAAPGDQIAVPLRIAAAQRLAAAGAARWSALLRVRRDVLYPLGAASDSIDGDDRLLRLQGDASGAGEPIPADSVLARPRFLVMLGAVERSPLRLERFAWEGAQVTVTTADGELALETCREGGPRLFDGGARFFLEQNRPNPFNAQTRISFGLAEAAPAELGVYDRLGRRVALLVRGVLAPGRYETDFDAGALPSGSYLLLLTTSQGARHRIMSVVK